MLQGRRTAVGVLTALALIALPASAQAASATITVGADPTESITTQLGVTGTADNTSTRAVINVKAAGGQACGANPSADNGTTVLGGGIATQGSFSTTVNWTPQHSASYVVCAWLTDFSSGMVYASASRSIVVRAPRLSISIAAPAGVPEGATFQVATTTQAETSRHLFVVAIQDSGRGCPANADAAARVEVKVILGDAGWGFTSVNGGPATASSNVSLTSPGAYLLCGYLWYLEGSDPPEAVASGAVNVVAPATVNVAGSGAASAIPPCVVPTIAAGSAQSVIAPALAGAGCSLGKVKHAASSRYAPGTLIRTSPKAGTSLAPSAAVDVVISTGQPCIVPHITGARLGSARSALSASGCVVGNVSKARSHRFRRGRVMSTSAPAGKRLATGAKVDLVVSKGRR